MASLPSFPTQGMQRRLTGGARNSYLLTVRLVSVLGVLGLSLIAGLFVSRPIYLYTAAVFAVVLMFYLVIRLPLAMFAIFIFVSMYVSTPYAFGILSGLSMSALTVAAMSVLWVVEMIVIRRQVVIHSSRAIFAAIAIAAISVLALIAGYLPWFPIEGADLDAQLAGTGIFVFSVLAFLLGVHKTTSAGQLRVLTFVYLALGGLFITGFFIRPIFGLIEARFLAGARGSMLWTWLAALSFSQALVNTSLRFRWRALLLGLSFLVFYALIDITRSWVSGWAPAIASVGVIVWFYFKRLRLPIVILGILGTIVFFQTSLWESLVRENAYSLLTRGQAYTILFEIIKVNPVLGLGPSNYYWYTPLFPILGWYVEFNSHNQYIDIIAQTGLLGISAVVWFMVEIFLMAWRNLKTLPEGFQRAYAFGVLGGVVGMAVSGFLGDWFLPFVYNVGMTGTSASLPPYLFMGGLVALVVMNRAKGPEGDDEAGLAPDPDGSLDHHR